MKRTLLMMTSLLACAASGWGDDVRASMADSLPGGTAFVQAEDNHAGGNYMWRRVEGATAGTLRDIGQRFVTRKSSVALRQIVVHVSPITKAVGDDAEGAAFTLSVLKYDSPTAVAPDSRPVLQVRGALPAAISPGQYLVLEIPETKLAAETTYGFLLSFDEPAAGRALNLSSTAREACPGGWIIFHTNAPDAAQPVYELKTGNLVFALYE